MKLDNKTLDKKIEEKIAEISTSFAKTNKLNIDLNFYQSITNTFLFTQKLTNLWESWKFHFYLITKQENNLLKGESDNHKQKENKIRKFIFEIIEKVNFFIYSK